MYESVPLSRLFSEIPSGVSDCKIESDVAISHLTHDSRRVQKGSLFFAISGFSDDGSKYIDEALEKGAVAVVIERAKSERLGGLRDKIPVVAVHDVRLAMALVAKKFYPVASDNFISIGVTGTNGKTSISWILAEALAELNYPSAQIGTLGMRVVDRRNLGASNTDFIDTSVTTPDPVVFHEFISKAEAQGARAAVFEVSSHSLEQQRVAGVNWNCAIFSNLTRDHLDYHGSFENYGAAKSKLFTDLLVSSARPMRVAVINIDDSFGLNLASRLRNDSNKVRLISYSAKNNSGASVALIAAKTSLAGMVLDIDILGEQIQLKTSLVGAFNIYNLLASIGCLSSLGFSPEAIVSALEKVPSVPGRLERIGGGEKFVFVDYAHTPDALICAQQAVREELFGRLITVFGCGGDRDRGKRPLMGEAVRKLSDFAVVTSDNSRTEDPKRIIDEIMAGVKTNTGSEKFDCRVIEDRREAIYFAINEARPGDCVLIAGKGHEDYQEIKGQKHSFCDRAVCREVLQVTFPSNSMSKL